MNEDIDYENIFPEDDSKFKSQEPKDTYIVRVSLNGAMDLEYNFLDGKGCNARDISEDFNKAIEYFNKGIAARKDDGGEIINPQIRKKDIVFTLLFNQGTDKSIKGVIGNSISKFLFNDMDWDKIVNGTGHPVNNRLFNVDFVKKEQNL